MTSHYLIYHTCCDVINVIIFKFYKVTSIAEIENAELHTFVVLNLPVSEDFDVPGIFSSCLTLDGVGQEGTPIYATGFIFGTKNMTLSNIIRWWNCSDTNLSLSMDYVHNICSNGWSLGTIGTTIFKDRVHLQPIFVPLCYSFTRTESSVPYVAAISQIIMVIHLATGTNIETIKQRIPLVQGDDAGAI